MVPSSTNLELASLDLSGSIERMAPTKKAIGKRPALIIQAPQPLGIQDVLDDMDKIRDLLDKILNELQELRKENEDRRV